MTNSSPEHAILDDFDSRPGSATSLIRTVLGAYRGELGGWAAIAELVELMRELGIAADATRIAVTRLKRRGVLAPAVRDGRAGYRLTAQAEAMYARGDRRIFGFRQMTDADPWRLISFTIPETLRATRHQLRRRLGWIGCGTVSPGLWIAPEYLAAEVTDIVAALGLSDCVTTFLATSAVVPDSMAEAAARWWDLDGIAARHREFLAHHAKSADARQLTPREAFVEFVPLLDEWRIIPYVDPGLPPSMLPADWPGVRSVGLFAAARDRCLTTSREWVRTLRQ
ncbi:regulator [Nocardia sp. CA2R105]|uniref:PaaX family transcriptional regulator n=1 Tax=Nocardia coffeae TaxID=2873381 RepID=UPI001CA658F3|nr:PaaX family transcriptional regulator C-terminal domain-containing protein [Nocardia coffeae]MBY8860724.1 regulator [Nocardia coffeae]